MVWDHFPQYQLEINHQSVSNAIPDVNNKGLAIIDMESWRPSYVQNFGDLSIYQKKSQELVRNENPQRNNATVAKEAERLFEIGARSFMESTMKVAQKLRPFAQWGYYIFPLCFNNNINIDQCSAKTQSQNDKYKSINYLNSNISS